MTFELWQATLTAIVTGIGGWVTAWVRIRRVRTEEKGGIRAEVNLLQKILEAERQHHLVYVDRHRQETENCVAVHLQNNLLRVYNHRCEKVILDGDLALPPKPEGYAQ